MNGIPTPNPFTPPRSDLRHATGSPPPSIEDALRRGYDFSIGALLGEAWRNTRGIKGAVLGGCAVFYLAVFVALFAFALVLVVAGLAGSDHRLGGAGLQMVLSLFTTAVTYPFLAGLQLIGIRRAAGQPAGFALVFAGFGRSLPLLATGLLTILFVYLGTLLLLLPGIYLGVAYLLALALVVERGLSPWQALEASRKAIGQHWFKVFGLLLSLSLILFVSALPLGLGLIWSLPLAVAALGVLYREIFGVRPAAS